MRYRPPRHPPVSDVYLLWLALVLLVVLAIGYACRQPVVADQPLPTMTATRVPTAAPTLVTNVSVLTTPVPTATRTPWPTSSPTVTPTATPEPTVTPMLTPPPTTVRAPVQIPARQP
jgi:hypothetical protein